MTAKEWSAAALEKLYAKHPVSEAHLLSRLRHQNKNLRRLGPLDLADDPAGGVTDQNHIGGSRAVFALAAAVGLTAGDRVLDLGCGVGGSARLLAYRFGCRVDGLDISRQRIGDAKRLTALVGLDDLVRFSRADMLRAPVARNRYDVLWGQSAWTHVADKDRLLVRWRLALKDGGRIAVEDVYRKRLPRTAAERRLLASLERDWRSTLVSLEDWRQIVAPGARIIKQQDLSRTLLRHFIRLDQDAERTQASVPALERRAWRNAIRAAGCGLIGYLRIAAARPVAARARGSRRR